MENEDVLYGSAIISQAGDSENIHINKDKDWSKAGISPLKNIEIKLY